MTLQQSSTLSSPFGSCGYVIPTAFFLLWHFQTGSNSVIPGWPVTHYVAQACMELVAIILQSSKYNTVDRSIDLTLAGHNGPQTSFAHQDDIVRGQPIVILDPSTVTEQITSQLGVFFLCKWYLSLPTLTHVSYFSLHSFQSSCGSCFFWHHAALQEQSNVSRKYGNLPGTAPAGDY